MGDSGVRQLVAGIFVAGAIGTAAELVLLEHVEGVWQKVPLALLVVGCAVLGLLMVRPRASTLRVFQCVMALFVLSGITGIFLHFTGNLAFERELDPEATGLPLVWESLKGATPALSPGTMMLLGALGLTYTYGHPESSSAGR